jgi:hypothetical protein
MRARVVKARSPSNERVDKAPTRAERGNPQRRLFSRPKAEKKW